MLENRLMREREKEKKLAYRANSISDTKVLAIKFRRAFNPINQLSRRQSKLIVWHLKPTNSCFSDFETRHMSKEKKITMS